MNPPTELSQVSARRAACAPAPELSSSNIDSYIEQSWDFLSRSHADLLEAAEDPKLEDDGRYPVFVSSLEDFSRLEAQLKEVLSEDKFSRIQLRVLPEDIREYPAQLDGGGRHGLLYLPHPYVVPGGRFNEMYGWDSYYINLGLLRAGRVDQAQAMVDNHLYQVRHYGRVLNANRTYYLTRSQPPFLASMVADVYRYTGDRSWLKHSLDELRQTYAFWTEEPHLTPETGLSRYFDLGEGPADEVLASEQDEDGRSHYDRIKEEFRRLATLPVEEQVSGLGYPLDLFYESSEDQVTSLFYLGDRAMRESGYDPSDRFGRFNLDVIHYNPVDLNSLLYLYEIEMSALLEQILQSAESSLWRGRAQRRKERMSEFLWDRESGLFFDYNVRTQQRRVYPFATAFFPLWTGWADLEQAAALYRSLDLFMRPGGVVTSTHRSGNQWDAPFGWAPLQWAAAAGLRRYGFRRASDEVAQAFTSLVEQEFQHSGVILEKYNVVERTSRVSQDIDFGYSSNEIGFGWTNAIYLLLRDSLRFAP